MSAVPLTYASAPIATSKLVDDVFRSYQVSGTGLVFAQGLTPFAIVCEGHAEEEATRKALKHAELAESGTSMTLDDAARITTSDVRFPTSPQTAAEKLYGWSVVVDLFHGVNHDISEAVRRFVLAVGPALHRLANTFEDGGPSGMDLVCRVLYEAQQECFAWVTRKGNTNRGDVPTFGSIQDKVLTYRAESLSTLPAAWYSMIDGPQSARRSANTPSASRQRAGVEPTFNSHADTRLMTRYREGGFQTISSMLEGHDVTIPKHAGKDVCLSWALKGSCSATCKRKAAHVRYSRDTIKSIHDLMDSCGVPNSQP